MSKPEDYDASLVDPYLQPNGVLVNKLGLTDTQTLNEQEADLVLVAAYGLKQQPVIGEFDLAHAKEIHRRLFSDIYPFAGQTRTVDIMKGNSAFTHHKDIEPTFSQIATDLREAKFLKDLPHEDCAREAGKVMGRLNTLHPFREGNGRTQREFVSELARGAGYHIEWDKMGRGAMVEACTKSFNGNDRLLENLIKNNLVTMSLSERKADAFLHDDPAKAVSKYPSLASGYAIVEASRHATKKLEEPSQRQYMSLIKERLADHIASGKELPNVTIKTKLKTQDIEHDF